MKTNYRKIDIFIDGKYSASTNWSKTCKQAKERFVAVNPQYAAQRIKCAFSTKA